MRVLAFGASITQGFWDTEGGWVQRLRRYYDELEVREFADRQPTVFNLGISGETSSRLLNRFEAEVNARRFPGQDFAFILSIGTNNSLINGDGSYGDSPENYRRDLNGLITKARQFSDKILFVGMPPCDEAKTKPVAWADVSFTNERIFEFENTMRGVCAEQNIPHVAVFETFQDEITAGRLLFSDGLHPNNDGHELIFRLVRPVLDEVLSS